MKKLFMALVGVLLLTSFMVPDGDDGNGTIVPLTPQIINNDNLGNGPLHGPILVPSASIDGHTFFINSSHPDYLLQLVNFVDDEEVVIYETLMPTGVNSVVLPASYTGEYVIKLIWGNWCFWGYINL